MDPARHLVPGDGVGASRREREGTWRQAVRVVAGLVAEQRAEADRVGIERQVRQALGDYFDRFGVVAQVGTESEPLREVKPWMDALIHEMETSELRRYERQAREAAEKAATLLRGQFINALTSRISKMERELTAMNRGLADHPFHNEKYSFHHTRLVEFQPILKIIEIGKTSPEALDMLFKGDEVPNEFPHRDTLREIEASPLAVESVRHGELPKSPKIERPMIVGAARRPGAA